MEKYIPIVLEWIKQRFCMNSIMIEDFPALPAGKKIIDKNSASMVVFYDVWTESVKEFF